MQTVKISGGPHASTIKIEIDGVEITGCSRIEINPVEVNGLVTAQLTLLVTDLDLTAELMGMRDGTN